MAFELGRRLYDMDYVEGGCIGPPPPGTNVDDTFGTYATDYLIGIIGIGGALALLLSSKPADFYKNLGANYLFWTGAGYGLAGLLHQVFHEDEQNENHMRLWKLSYIFTLFGVMALGLLVNRLLLAKNPSLGKSEVCMNAVVLVVTGGVIAQNLFGEPTLIITGVCLGIMTLYALIVWALWSSWAKVLGCVLQIIGFIVQVALAPQCGDDAYAECWKECPLPAPYFNHNALFHLLYAIGLLIVAATMISHPEVTEESKFSLLSIGGIGQP